MKKMLTVQEILDENTRIETIEDKETLKNVLRSIIDVTSYSIKKDDIVEATKEIYREYDIIL
jgi:prophage maintenance system killer protein